jgi:hypothetical protein
MSGKLKNMLGVYANEEKLLRSDFNMIGAARVKDGVVYFEEINHLIVGVEALEKVHEVTMVDLIVWVFDKVVDIDDRIGRGM